MNHLLHNLISLGKKTRHLQFIYLMHLQLQIQLKIIVIITKCFCNYFFFLQLYTKKSTNLQVKNNILVESDKHILTP